ncbi:MAG: sigma-54-dependent Fis family transcriptional regulator, partial [Spirochaetia bacterium]|nr:sigma-54-dependent Fis family transcriptional regulator [Spirochaetia bacterium]
LNQQKKLLRVLQENEFMRLGGTRPVKNTARLVFAVNRDLKAMVDQGLFREDLYYRINACKISLPPLRERREEIIPLAIFFIRQMIDKYNLKIEAITRSCLDLLMSHNWPGNIRELKNSLNGSLVLFEGGTITEEVFSVLKKNTGSISAGSMVSKPGMQLPEGPFDLNLFIDDIIKATLQKFDGNKSKTAEYLGLSRFQLYRGYKPRS